MSLQHRISGLPRAPRAPPPIYPQTLHIQATLLYATLSTTALSCAVELAMKKHPCCAAVWRMEGGRERGGGESTPFHTLGGKALTRAPLSLPLIALGTADALRVVAHIVPGEMDKTWNLQAPLDLGLVRRLFAGQLRRMTGEEARRSVPQDTPANVVDSILQSNCQWSCRGCWGGDGGLLPANPGADHPRPIAAERIGVGFDVWAWWQVVRRRHRHKRGYPKTCVSPAA
jgi:hypothetical protein